MQQHEQLEKYIEELQENPNKDSVDYKKLMKEHIDLENKEFYPLLDKKLSEKEQEVMLANAKDYLLGNIAN